MGDSTTSPPARVAGRLDDTKRQIGTKATSLAFGMSDAGRKAALAGLLAVSALSSPAAAAGGVVPLQADDAVQALFESGLGVLVQTFLLIVCVILSIGAIAMVAAAGISRMSQDSSRQGKFKEHMVDAGILLGIVCVVGAGPEILAAMGFTTMEYISPIRVFA